MTDEAAPDSAPIVTAQSLHDHFEALLARLTAWEHEIKDTVKADLEAIITKIKTAL